MATSSRPKLCTKETVKNEGLNIWVDSTLDGVEPKVDIILVQGLGAHPYWTWVGRQDRTTTGPSRSKLKFLLGRGKTRHEFGTNPTIDEGVFWPRDLLPEHVGPARIATYSYLSAWEKKGFRTSLRECGEQFLNIVYQSRPDESSRNRPIIFVGHSLGGLVIQQALVLADHSRIFTGIRTSTSGIVFLGVPMQGSGSANVLAFITDTLGNEQPMLRTLKAGSQELNALSNDFWSSYGALPSIFFCETHDSRYIPLLKTTTVNVRSSSVIGRRSMFLHTDHSGLNKFKGEDDEKFSIVLPSLKEMITAAQTHCCNSDDRREYGGDMVVGSDKTVSQTLPSGTGKIILPFPRDETFVGRNETLEKIEEILHSEQQDSRVALVGLGGIGKSQIAIEYAHKTRANHPDTSIFWVYGTNTARFRSSYADIAKELRLPGCDDPKQDQLDSVRRWLQGEASGRWLMILDNVDDRSFVTNYHDKAAMIHEFTLLAYLPRKPGTMILVTSRDRDAAYDLVHQKHNNILEIYCMDDTDTKALLDVKLDDPQAVETEKEQLIRKLDSIPLAITQAAAYVKRRRMVTISKYLELLESCEEDPKSVLNIDGGDSRRNPGVPNAVFRTWQITLDIIRTQHPQSADLMSIMAMFDRQGIPGFLFNSRPKLLKAGGDEVDDSDCAACVYHPRASSRSDEHPFSGRSHYVDIDYRTPLVTSQGSNLELPDHRDGPPTDINDRLFGSFEDAIEVLLDLSLVTVEEGGVTFQMHRLVQLATRRWLKDCGSLQYFSDKALHILSQTYPTGVDKDWKIYQALEPHAEAVHGRLYQSKQSRNDHARLSHLRSGLFIFQGSYSRAVAMAKTAIEEYCDIGECGSEDYFRAFADLFWAHMGRGAYTDAERIVPVLAQAQLSLGKEHPTYIDLLRVKGKISSKQDRYEEGVEILRTALDLARMFLGRKDSLTLWCSEDLATGLWCLGHLDEAEELCVSTLKIRKETLGESHPSILVAMEILASIHSSQGRAVESEMMLRHVLDLNIELYGEEHPDTLITKYNLACAFALQDRLEDAEALEADVLSVEIEKFGTHHPSTIHTMSDLARIYMEQRRYGEALSLLIKALHVSEEALGFYNTRTQRRRQMLTEWFRELQQDDATKHHTLEAEQQAKALLQERYSSSLSRCLYALYFQRACQAQTSTISGQDGSAKLYSMSRQLAAALHIWIHKSSYYGIQTIGRILGVMNRSTDAQIAFEGLVEECPPYEGLTGDSPSPRMGHVTDDSSERFGEEATRQGLKRMNQDTESETPILKHIDGESVTEGCEAKGPADGEDESVSQDTEDGNEEYALARESAENRSSMSSGRKSGTWGCLAVCDNCEKVFGLLTARYFCIECFDLDLCKACYGRLQVKGTLPSEWMKDCNRHKFISAPRPEWHDLPWGVVSDDGTTLREWAEKLLAEFSE